MKISILSTVSLLCITTLLLFGFTPSPQKIHTLYSSLDPLSIRQQLAFYHLYPDSSEGKQALKQAWNLLDGNDQETTSHPLALGSANSIEAILSLVNKPSHQKMTPLPEEALTAINTAAKRLSNRQLPGFLIWTEKEMLTLPSKQIDIGRALLLSQLDDPQLIRSYEAMLDLMALQITVHLPDQASPQQKISAINRFLFEEMHYRFPPHSLYSSHVDQYTLLPSVLDSQRGVCLGVSLLYLCIAQRIDLDLELVTPPGHIYLRYRKGNTTINIETTARGVDIPSEYYLNVNTRSLQQRTLKEAIGLAYMNQASVFWRKDNHQQAIDTYRKAEQTLPNDPLIREFLAYNLLFSGKKREGEKLLRSLKGHLPDHAVSGNTIVDDYLSGKIDENSIKAVFQQVDETRESILQKQQNIQKVLKEYPQFREGHFHLAITWLQLNRTSEALSKLSRYHEIDTNNAIVEYYLAALHASRRNFPLAWKHLHRAEELTSTRNHYPKVLRMLRHALTLRSPEKTQTTTPDTPDSP